LRKKASLPSIPERIVEGEGEVTSVKGWGEVNGVVDDEYGE
jgi:hypothetical protein